LESLLTKTRIKKAFSLIEILVAIVIFTIFATGIFTLGISNMERSSKTQTNNEALSYAQEGLEATRNMRDRDFLLLATGSFGLDFSNDTWSFITAPETIDNYYQRTITVEDVYRDSSGDIADTGTVDHEIRKVTSEVTWNWKNITSKSVSLVTYLTDWRGNDWIRTTCAEFLNGIFTYTATSETPAPPEDNCAIQLELLEGLSTFYASSDIGEHGNDVVVSGNYAYVATAKSNEGLVIVDISDPAAPAVVQTVNIKDKGRYLTIKGSYLYIGVDDRNDSLAVVDISDPENATLVTNYNLSAHGNQPDTSGNYMFMGIDKNSNSFLVFDISTPSAPSQKASLNFNGATNVITIDGNYAYAGIDTLTDQLRIIDISNPLNPSEVASVNVGDEVISIAINGVIAYVGTEDDNNSLQIVNISDPENPILLGSMATNDKIQDMAIDGNYLYAAIDTNNSGLDVINISNPTSPYIAYSADITGEGTGIYTYSGNVYITTDVNNRGLVIKETISPSYSTNGTFISDALDTGSEDTRYNFIEWTHTDTIGGEITVQTRTASSTAGLSSATWVGSDGTSGTSYTASPTQIVTDAGASGKRYIQFRVTITSDGIETPTLDEVKINYTP